MYFEHTDHENLSFILHEFHFIPGLNRSRAQKKSRKMSKTCRTSKISFMSLGINLRFFFLKSCNGILVIFGGTDRNFHVNMPK